MLKKRRLAVSAAAAPRTSEPTVRLPEAPSPARSVPPLATVTVPASVPLPPSLAPEATEAVTVASVTPLTIIVPPFAERATGPVIGPPKVKVPAPVLTMPLVPVPATLPSKLVFAPVVRTPVEPRVSAAEVAPRPLSVGMVCVVPLRSSVAPATLAKVTTELGEKAELAPAWSVPALITVATA